MLKLSDYQVEAVKWLTGKYFALLALDMGLGKTACVVSAADLLDVRRILIICPAVARENWRREFKMWSVFWDDFSVCFGKDDYPTDRTIVSYDYATNYKSRLVKRDWDLVVNDEAHFVKEPEAKRTIAIYGKTGIVRKTRFMWNLSGTPAPNHIGELWPMLFTFGVTRLSYADFVEEFCTTRPTFYHGKRQQKVIGTKREKVPEIRQMLDQIMLRRMKEDVLKDLPPISYEEMVVEGVFPIAETTYENDLNYVKERGLVGDLIERGGESVLEGIANSVSTLRRLTGIQKIAPVAEMVAQELEANAYDKIIIFGIHTQVIEELEKRLGKFGAVSIYGKTSPKKRQENIDRFQNDKDCRVFLGNIIAAGTAITLTAASQVLLIEQSWVPGENAQAIMRAHRRGQKHPVFVRFIALEDSIDQRVVGTLRRKTQDLTRIFNVASDI